MTTYLIHCCPQREQYVNDYLVPSMIKQGIARENILIYNDSFKLGNLKAYMAASELVTHNSSATWHLQDDIVISSDFKKVTEAHNSHIICGFCNSASKEWLPGIRPVREMWYSFPCIRIPNKTLKEFVEWLMLPRIQRKFKYYIESNKFDDTLFREFMLDAHSDRYVFNLSPNIVDTIDYLIGGSTLNNNSSNRDTRSIYFSDKQSIRDLQKYLID